MTTISSNFWYLKFKFSQYDNELIVLALKNKYVNNHELKQK
jgi:hypothetical protein